MAVIPDDNHHTFAKINYVPHDRLANKTPFVSGVAAKPAGANEHLADTTKAEFEAADLPNKISSFTFLGWDEQWAFQRLEAGT